MYEKNKNVFYYITLGNENYVQLPQPAHVKDEDILSGMYLFQKSALKSDKKAHVFGSGAILNEAIKAAKILEIGISNLDRYLEHHKLQRPSHRCNGRRALECVESWKSQRNNHREKTEKRNRRFCMRFGLHRRHCPTRSPNGSRAR
jgi:pyruvate dehydrogenase complex dehydrogenase (E1) component